MAPSAPVKLPHVTTRPSRSRTVPPRVTPDEGNVSPGPIAQPAAGSTRDPAGPSPAASGAPDVSARPASGSAARRGAAPPRDPAAPPPAASGAPDVSARPASGSAASTATSAVPRSGAASGAASGGATSALPSFAAAPPAPSGAPPYPASTP